MVAHTDSAHGRGVERASERERERGDTHLHTDIHTCAHVVESRNAAALRTALTVVGRSESARVGKESIKCKGIMQGQVQGQGSMHAHRHTKVAAKAPPLPQCRPSLRTCPPQATGLCGRMRTPLQLPDAWANGWRVRLGRSEQKEGGPCCQFRNGASITTRHTCGVDYPAAKQNALKVLDGPLDRSIVIQRRQNVRHGRI